jgi:crotonobetainyl-CoA:carnitine CoA-transferase CaiB-like acyl-CoA transferase
MESVANLSDWALPNYSRSPMIGHRDGTGIFALYRCVDGWVRMIILAKHHWRALLEWIGNPEELADPALEDLVPRLERTADIEPLVERFFAGKRKIDVACEAQLRGIPATPLLRPSEVIGCEHCEARGTFSDLELAPGLVAKVPSGFFTIDGSRVGPGSGSPAFDECRGADVGAAPFDRVPDVGAVSAAADPYPFRGIRVLDFGVGAVGVEVGRLLAEFGADVVKIETRKAPDFIRVLLGSFMNPSFASSNRSKRSLGVDLKTPAGRDLLLRLVVDADVVIENSGAGVMERFGLGYATLREKNPGIVMFSSQMMGSAGPWKDWIGYGPSTHPVCGLQYLWNYPEDAERPAGSTNIYPDHFVGRLGAFGVVAALFQRRKTGRGTHIDAAQFESAIQLLGDLFARENLAPGSVAPLGNESALGAPWGAYPCAGHDEWCVINVRGDDEWRALCDALGDPEWAQRPAYREAAGRIEGRDEIDRALAEWTAARGPREVMERLQNRGVPAGIVAHPGHHFEDPQLAARGYHKRVEQRGFGEIVVEGTPFLGSDLPEPITTPAPLLGEHTREICRERLGLSDAEIDALFAAGVLEDPP